MPVTVNPQIAIPMDNGLAVSAIKTMVNGDVIFTISGGPVAILELISVCQTANDATASTMQYKSNPSGAGMTATTFSGASASLASAALGATVRLHPTALTTAPALIAASAGGVSLGLNVSNKVVVHPGTVSVVIGVGSTTGTWKHYMKYMPLSPEAKVV